MKFINCGILRKNAGAFPFGLNEEEKDCENLKADLRACLISLIERKNICSFTLPLDLGFTMYASEIILDLKKVYPFISLECVISFEELPLKWPEFLRDRYFSILENCDKETIIEKRPSNANSKKTDDYIFNNCSLFLYEENESIKTGEKALIA